MDTETILNSVNTQVENNTEVETTIDTPASDAGVDNTVETTAPTTPVDVSENKNDVQTASEQKAEPARASGAPNASAEARESEPKRMQERKVFHRSSNPLKQAQYAASKWQKKYKRLLDEFNATRADYERYKDLDLTKFDNEEEKQKYLAWKASRQQRLTDMQDDLGAIRNEYQTEQAERFAEYDREVYDNKVARIYGDRAAEFEALDDEWNDVYETACATYDRRNVIKDYIKNSPIGPAIKNIIYKNGELQHDLFETGSGNDMIDANRRLNILKGVERSIMRFLSGGSRVQTAPTAAPQAAAQKRSLPHLPPRKSVKSSGVSAPNVTGSLTHTDKGSTPDVTSEVSNLYRSVFGG